MEITSPDVPGMGTVRFFVNVRDAIFFEEFDQHSGAGEKAIIYATSNPEKIQLLVGPI
jgi:hypothetical protein